MAMITELDRREIAAEEYEFDPAEVTWRNKLAPVMLHHITVRTGRLSEENLSGYSSCRLVDKMTLTYTDGTDVVYGRSDGERSGVFTLDVENFEYIVRVNGRQGDMLDGIQFVTNYGRESTWFGGGGGQPFSYTVTPGQMVFGLESKNRRGYCPRIDGVVGATMPKLPGRRWLFWLLLNRRTRKLALSGNPSLLRMTLRGRPSVLRLTLKGTPSLLRLMFRGRDSFVRLMLTGEENWNNQSSLFRLLCSPGSYGTEEDASVMQIMMDSADRERDSITKLMLLPNVDRRSVARMFLGNRKKQVPLYEMLFERDMENGYPSILQLVLERNYDKHGNRMPSIIDYVLRGERKENGEALSLLRLMLIGRPYSIFDKFLEGEVEGKTSLMRMMVEDKRMNGLSITRRVLSHFENAKGHRQALFSYFVLGEEQGRPSVMRSMVAAEARTDLPSLLSLLMHRYEYKSRRARRGLIRMGSSRVIRGNSTRQAGRKAPAPTNVKEQEDQRIAGGGEGDFNFEIKDAMEEGLDTELWRKKSLLEVLMTGDPSIFDLFLDGELTGEDSLARMVLGTSATFKDGRIVLGGTLTSQSHGMSLFRLMVFGEEDGGPGMSLMRLLLLGEQDNGFSVLRLLLMNETTDEPSILRVLLTMLKTILVASKQRKGDITKWKSNVKQILKTIASSQKKKGGVVKNVVGRVSEVLSTGLVNYQELVNMIQRVAGRDKEMERIWKAQFLKVAHEIELSGQRTTKSRHWPGIARKWSKLAKDIAYQRWTRVITGFLNVGLDLGKLLPEAVAALNDELKS